MSVTQKIKNNISEKGFWPALRSFLLHRLGRQTSSPILDIYYSQPLDENKILLLGLGKSVRGSLQLLKRFADVVRKLMDLSLERS